MKYLLFKPENNDKIKDKLINLIKNIRNVNNLFWIYNFYKQKYHKNNHFNWITDKTKWSSVLVQATHVAQLLQQVIVHVLQ